MKSCSRGKNDLFILKGNETLAFCSFCIISVLAEVAYTPFLAQDETCMKYYT